MCHFPAEALFCRAVEKCFIYKLFSCAFFLSFKFIFLSALEKISTAEEMEASCWINSIMIFLQLSSTLVCCILHKRGREVERKHEISPLPVGMLETFFINCIKFVIFTHTKKIPRVESQRKNILQLFACISDSVDCFILKYCAITSFYYHRDYVATLQLSKICHRIWKIPRSAVLILSYPVPAFSLRLWRSINHCLWNNNLSFHKHSRTLEALACCKFVATEFFLISRWFFAWVFIQPISAFTAAATSHLRN